MRRKAHLKRRGYTKRLSFSHTYITDCSCHPVRISLIQFSACLLYTSMLISTIDYNEYVGRIGVGKVENGTISVNQDMVVVNPVSYTHLTELVRMLGSWDGIPITYAGGIGSMEDLETVSYTHLDVYKRQSQGLSRTVVSYPVSRQRDQGQQHQLLQKHIQKDTQAAHLKHQDR